MMHYMENECTWLSEFQLLSLLSSIVLLYWLNFLLLLVCTLYADHNSSTDIFSYDYLYSASIWIFMNIIRLTRLPVMLDTYVIQFKLVWTDSRFGQCSYGAVESLGHPNFWAEKVRAYYMLNLFLYWWGLKIGFPFYGCHWAGICLPQYVSHLCLSVWKSWILPS